MEPTVIQPTEAAPELAAETEVPAPVAEHEVAENPEKGEVEHGHDQPATAEGQQPEPAVPPTETAQPGEITASSSPAAIGRVGLDSSIQQPAGSFGANSIAVNPRAPTAPIPRR